MNTYVLSLFSMGGGTCGVGLLCCPLTPLVVSTTILDSSPDLGVAPSSTDVSIKGSISDTSSKAGISDILDMPLFNNRSTPLKKIFF